MQEDFLHYVWKHKKFTSTALATTDGEAISIVHIGQHNYNAGPDFFNAKIYIGSQLWAGNVEIHITSSDWYAHHHETDTAYDNVILHVVWEHDTEVFRNDNSKIPTLVLKNYLQKDVLQNYNQLLHSKSWINCEADFHTIDTFIVEHWLERLFFERLERKSRAIETLLANSNKDWEAVLFKLLAKNFGLKVNGDSFLSLASSVSFSIVRKLQTNIVDLEALYFGQLNLLNEAHQDTYYLDLQQRYQFIKNKFSLDNQGVLPVHYFRLRPPNFPTIRLSQLANVYYKERNLFSKVIQCNTKAQMYDVFNVETSTYWQTHYTFSTTSKPSKKQLSKRFVDLLIINTLIPLKFAYAKINGNAIEDNLLALIKTVAPETNSIVHKFYELRALPKTALHSQALLQLKTEYCNKNACLQCAIGNRLIAKNK